jgi:hypothetical protein
MGGCSVEFETGREVVEHDVRMLGCPSQLLVTRQLPCYSFVVHQHSESCVRCEDCTYVFAIYLIHSGKSYDNL